MLLSMKGKLCMSFVCLFHMSAVVTWVDVKIMVLFWVP